MAWGHIGDTASRSGPPQIADVLAVRSVGKERIEPVDRIIGTVLE
jgi:hypothetical protein